MTELDEQDIPEQPDVQLAPDEQEAVEAEEAAQAEAGPDIEPDEQAEPEAQPEAQGTTETEWEARFKAIDRSFNTYQRAVERQLAEDGDDYCRCPMCLGETPGFLNKAQAGRFPDEQADLVKQFLGLARPVDYQQSSRHRRCPECGGKGKVKTDSEVPGQETIQCEDCTGHGYVGPTRPLVAAAANGSEGVTGPTVYNEPEWPADKDEWDQPRLLPNGHDNPNYGRMPNHWIKVEPWGDTRGLTAQDAVAR